MRIDRSGDLGGGGSRTNGIRADADKAPGPPRLARHWTRSGVDRECCINRGRANGEQTARCAIRARPRSRPRSRRVANALLASRLQQPASDHRQFARTLSSWARRNDAQVGLAWHCNGTMRPISTVRSSPLPRIVVGPLL